MHQGLFDSISNWLAEPFNDDMDVIEWAAFIVVMSTIAFMWWRVLVATYGETN